MARIGWIGLGNMGNPMCLNLVKAGYDVTVWNRTKSKADNVIKEGASWADSPRKVAEKTDILFTMVADGTILNAVALVDDGYVAGLKAGKIVVDMSTVSVEESMKINSAVEECGCKMFRAPVTGSTALAQAGTLGILASGEREVYEKLLPIFEKVGNKQFYLGAAEEARVLKLAINTMIATTMQMEAEAVVLCEKAGLNVKQVTDVIADSAVGSSICKYKAATIAEGVYKPAFSVKLMMKDLDLALAAAKQYGVPMLSTSVTRQQLASASATGRAEKDFAILTQLVEEAAGYERM
ncbi:MAG: NAD(P)-dependent oxidoreductase [Firmicutes bacterium]|nr:NAD(P)-dependent oxidoreductase [Bacillota bacterium]